jgi:hypothetical protein
LEGSSILAVTNFWNVVQKQHHWDIVWIKCSCSATHLDETVNLSWS